MLTDSERARISIALFYTLEGSGEIRPLEDLIDEERSIAYKNMKDYADICLTWYQQGIRAIHFAKV